MAKVEGTCENLLAVNQDLGNEMLNRLGDLKESMVELPDSDNPPLIRLT